MKVVSGYHVGYRGNFYSLPTYEDAKAKWASLWLKDDSYIGRCRIGSGTYNIMYGVATVVDHKLVDFKELVPNNLDYKLHRIERNT
jgi:hypothetical protein